VAPTAVYATNLEDFARDGYAVVDETNVSNEFEGCDYDKRYALDNGLVFVCQTYSFTPTAIDPRC
jgi:hypothetical protein